MAVYTLGYEGMTLDRFLRDLREQEIQTLVDVRAMPLSRKPGFSKRSLSAALEAHKIAYTHCVAVGCPSEIRKPYQETGDWGVYTKRYLTYLETQQEALDSLLTQVVVERCCLLCFETDPYTCHRSFVAARLQEMSREELSVIHLPGAAKANVVRDQASLVRGLPPLVLAGR